MEYELAKQLKDTGFPQKSPRETWCTECNETALYARCYKHKKEYIVFPTLSELIEACGDDFFRLIRADEGIWAASDTHHYRYESSTPEEAVAKLWLELNKKND